MILLSLVLVLVSLGLLVAGLAGASQPLVWASIVASVAAGASLAAAALRRRGQVAEQAELTGPQGAPVAGESASDRAGVTGPAGVETARPAGGSQPLDGRADSAAPMADSAAPMAGAAVPAGQPALGAAGQPGEAYPDPPDEPPEEDVSAPDALRVVDLDVQVHVVDGRPRYHLADCPHLADREVVPLPVAEAREAGFTPCSLCKPDGTLARQDRQAATGPAQPGGPGGDQPRAEPPTEGPTRR